MYQFISGSVLIAVALNAQTPQPSTIRSKVAQTPPVQSYQPKATSTARKEQILDQQQKSAPSRFDMQKYPVGDRYIQHWQESLWAIGVLAPEKDYALQALENILQMTTAANLTDPQKAIIDTAMQVSHQLYTLKPAVYSRLRPHFVRTIDSSTDPQWVALSLSALAKSAIYPPEVTGTKSNQNPAIAKLIKNVQTRFPKWSEDLHLRTTIQNIQNSSTSPQSNPQLNTQANKKPSIPDLGELLRWQIAPQQPQMYVLCRPNRDVLCVTLLKDGNGKFVRQKGQKNNQLWSVPLLLQSIHNLDWNFTNGRTPQGVYRMEGISRQPDDEYFHAYGQFALVNLFVPFEDGANRFLPNQKGKFTGDLKAYQALLPPTWRNFAPIQETFWAGKMGRSLFRIHGSGAALDFFQNKAATVSASNFDWNPTLGCLSAIELYDDRGSLVKADMPKILNALNTVGKGKIDGYLIVVDVPSNNSTDKGNVPITIAEIEKFIQP